VHLRRIDAAGTVLAEAHAAVRVAPRGFDASIDVASLVGAPTELGLLPESPPVGVVLTGPTATVEAARGSLRAILDARGATAGRARLPVKYQLPAGMESTVRIDGPPVAECVLEARVEREFTIDLEWVDAAPVLEDNALSRSATPSKVRANGWVHDVDRVAKVVARVRRSNAIPGEFLLAPVIALDADGKSIEGLTFDPASVQVRFAAKIERVRKRVVLNPKIVGNITGGWRIASVELVPPTVTLEGPMDRLSELSSLEIDIDVRGIEAERRVAATVIPPTGFSVLDNTPVEAVVRCVRASVAPPKSPAPRPATDRATTPPLEIPGPGGSKP